MMLDSADDAIAILQHRDLAERRQSHQRVALRRIAEVDAARLERRVVLVQRDQHLVAERGERMEVEHERHGSLRRAHDGQPSSHQR